MKKFFKVIYCAAFFAICAFFSLGMLIPGASLAEEGSSAAPRLIEGGAVNSAFGDDFENWFSKNFAFRSETVSLFSAIREEVFCTGNDQVTVGKDGFLFFNESLTSYAGTSPMSDEDIGKAADALCAMSEYAKDHAARFIFTAAPGKATIYPEMLPERFGDPDSDDLSRLHAELDKRGVEYVDLRPALTDAKNSGLLYHKRDTHWNGYGAYIAFGKIADAAGISTLDPGDFKESYDFEGDLDRLLYPGETRYDRNSSPDLGGKYIFTSSYSTPMDLTISTRGGGDVSVLMFRDSFANALIPYFASCSKEVTFERANPYRIDLLEEKGADIVIVEIAERNLSDLISSDARIGAE